MFPGNSIIHLDKIQHIFLRNWKKDYYTYTLNGTLTVNNTDPAMINGIVGVNERVAL